LYRLQICTNWCSICDLRGVLDRFGHHLSVRDIAAGPAATGQSVPASQCCRESVVCDTPRPREGAGCHKPVSLGVVLVVLYHIGVVLVGTVYWYRAAPSGLAGWLAGWLATAGRLSSPHPQKPTSGSRLQTGPRRSGGPPGPRVGAREAAPPSPHSGGAALRSGGNWGSGGKPIYPRTQPHGGRGPGVNRNSADWLSLTFHHLLCTGAQF
jgi:hypothetical protein